jgi:hypothetical protein
VSLDARHPVAERAQDAGPGPGRRGEAHAAVAAPGPGRRCPARARHAEPPRVPHDHEDEAPGSSGLWLSSIVLNTHVRCSRYWNLEAPRATEEILLYA